MLAIIGGTGLARLATLAIEREQTIDTPYGAPSAPVAQGRLAGIEALFLARHGHGHTIPPHRINYRANLWALEQCGATHVVAVAAVGGIGPAPPGSLVLPHQIIDYTHGRAHTFFDGDPASVGHVDFTHPYTPELRRACLAAARRCGIAIDDGGVYGAVSGPRLETAAEIDRMERDGATMVGMTGMPEASLARELGLAYATIAVIVNPAAGRGESAQAISMDALLRTLETGMAGVRAVLQELASTWTP